MNDKQNKVFCPFDRIILNSPNNILMKSVTQALGIHSFFYKNVVFPAQAEYSYFFADFRLEIFMYYS